MKKELVIDGKTYCKKYGIVVEKVTFPGGNIAEFEVVDEILLKKINEKIT